ncbi:MAG: hypothetical protein B7Y41_03075 [Hydrogenophilales bacterium 28-61-23]|nr:MAG: hypothetical protein B7Y41_03075 [Hydrogenophilales bacterium 28-61-23]
MRYLVLFLLASISIQAQADSQATVWGDSYKQGNFESDFEENTKTWQEIEAQLPPAPKAGNLIEVKLDASTRNTLLIDAASLSAGDDGVVRYTAIIRSPSGAETVSFEGLRCVTGERKLYAFGRAGGKDATAWSRNRNAKWEPIQARLAGGYHRELFFHYLCTVNTRHDVPTLLRLLKSGGIYAQ